MSKIKGINAKFVGYQNGERPKNNDDIVDKKYLSDEVVNKDTMLDEGGSNEVSASDIKALIDNPLYSNKWADPDGGYIMDGVDDYASIPDNANLDITNTITMEAFIYYEGGGAVAGKLFSRDSGMAGGRYYYLNIDANNRIHATLWDDSDVVHATTADATTEINVNSWNHIIVTYDGSDIRIYNNSVLLQTTNVGGFNLKTGNEALYIGTSIGGVSIQSFKGIYCFSRLFNKALTQAEVTNLWNNGEPEKAAIPYEMRGASQTANYESDFSTGTDGWNMDNGTITGNVDGISDGIISKDNAVSMYPTNVSAQHRIYKAITSYSISTEKRYRVSFSYYIPSTNSNVDGMLANLAAGFVRESGDALQISTTGAWTEYSVNGYFTFSPDGTFRIYQTVGGNGTFTGAGSSSDDLCYITNFKITQIGNVLNLKPLNAGANGWVGELGGEVVIANTSGDPINQANVKDGRAAVSTTEVVLSNTWKKNYRLVGITAIDNSGSSNTITIGTTSGGTDIANAVAVSGSSAAYISLNSPSVSDFDLYATAGASSIDLILDYEPTN